MTTAADTTLGDFEGDAVESVGIEIPSAAGGLRDALAIDPIVMHKDDESMVLLRCKVQKIRHDPVKDSDGWRRVHILETTSATIVDGDVFEEALAAQAERIEKAKAEEQRRKDAEAGQGRIDDAAVDAAHDAGDHAGGLVVGCSKCEAEKAAVEAEDA